MAERLFFESCLFSEHKQALASHKKSKMLTKTGIYNFQTLSTTGVKIDLRLHFLCFCWLWLCFQMPLAFLKTFIENFLDLLKKWLIVGNHTTDSEHTFSFQHLRNKKYRYVDKTSCNTSRKKKNIQVERVLLIYTIF